VTGQAHWFSIVFLILGFGSILGLLLWNVVADRRYRIETHRHICPQTGRDVQTVHVRDAFSGRWLGVQSCSAFGDPEAVICTRECVKELNARFAGSPALSEVRS